MKIEFILPKNIKNIKETKLSSKTDRRGYGNTIIGSVFGGKDNPKKTRTLSARYVEIEVKRKSRLKDDEIRDKNESEWQRLNNQAQKIEEAKPIYERSEFLQKEHSRMIDELKKIIKKYEEYFKRVYNECPPRPFSKYKELELARIYTSVVYENNAPKPDQTYLFQITKISQSTWSRAFRKLIFWENVKECFLPIWNATPVVEQRLDLLKQKLREAKETPAENLDFKKSTHYKPGVKKGKVNSVDEFNLDAQIDAERFKSWDRNRLIRTIQLHRPEANQDELRNSTDDELREIVDNILQ